jgi:hypothetical protein
MSKIIKWLVGIALLSSIATAATITDRVSVTATATKNAVGVNILLTGSTGVISANALKVNTITMNGNIRLNGNYLSGDGGNEGVYVSSTGLVGIGTAAPSTKLEVAGTVSANDFATVAYFDYGATSTIVGFSSLTDQTIYFHKIGKLVFCEFYIQGTSNSTDFTFTLPYTPVNSNPASKFSFIYFGDNSSESATPGRLQLNKNSTTVTLKTTWSGGAWTAANLKWAGGSFFYEAAN